MTVTANGASDAELVDVFLEPIRKCADYTPAFGKGRAEERLTVEDFARIYGADRFYSLIGLDSPLMYAAHKAAGGLTSVYRQVGIGSERLFRRVLITSLELKAEQVTWSYEYEKGKNKGTATHTLDALLRSSDLGGDANARVADWLERQKVKNGIKVPVDGAVFEVRQGYKSADSKRQAADLRFGISAIGAGLLPVFAIMSAQVSEPVLRRYRNAKMVVLTGSTSDDPLTSTFAFTHKVIGFDLGGFFHRNAAKIRGEITGIVRALLQVDAVSGASSQTTPSS